MGKYEDFDWVDLPKRELLQLLQFYLISPLMFDLFDVCADYSIAMTAIQV